MIDKEIKIKSICMGCHACASVCPKKCITMEADEEGFLYPTVDYSLCIKCNKCVYICPTINHKEVDNNPVAYACINDDEMVRMNSSSGGIFTLLAEQILDQGGVVFGAGFDSKFNVEHIFVESKEILWKLRGSKYVQSKIGHSYNQTKEFLETGRAVLFTGTPCQVVGLTSYLGKYYTNLKTIDIICHGVPSPDIWSKYVSFRVDKAGAPAQRITFRRKDEGWKRYSVSFTFKNNTEYRANLRDDLFMRAFLKDVCLRPSCYSCKFKGINRQSDITLADFWGIQSMLPEMDDDKGTSLIFINSAAGSKLFNQIKDKVMYKKVDIHEAVKHNSAAIKSVPYNSNRDRFMKEKDVLDFDKLVNKYCTDSLSVRVKRKVKTSIKKGINKIKSIGVNI